MTHKELNQLIAEIVEDKYEATRMDRAKTLALLAIAIELKTISEALPGAGRGY